MDSTRSNIDNENRHDMYAQRLISMDNQLAFDLYRLDDRKPVRLSFIEECSIEAVDIQHVYIAYFLQANRINPQLIVMDIAIVRSLVVE
jgi:hypothetical protein